MVAHPGWFSSAEAARPAWSMLILVLHLKKKKIARRKRSVGLDFLAVCPLVLCLTGRFSHAYIKVFAERMQLACTYQKLL